MDPLSPARYCECCGREISPNQNESGAPHRAAAQPETVEADAGLYDWAPKRSAWDLRCPSCGGPSLDAGRCQACQKAAAPIEPVQQVAPASQVAPTPGVHPVEEIVPFVPTASTESVAKSEAANTARPAAQDAVREITKAAAKIDSSAASVKEQGATTPAKEKPVQKIEVAPDASKAQAVPSRHPRIESTPAERAPRPPVPPRRPPVPVAVPAAPPRRRHPIALAAAIVVVAAASGVGISLRFHDEKVIARAEPATAVADDAPQQGAAVQHLTLPAERRVTAPPSEVSPNPLKPVPPPARAQRVAAKPAPAAKPVRVSAPAREASVAPAVNRATSAPASAPVAQEVVAAAPTRPEPAAAAGPFFETKDVNESPRVAARVEPRLPVDLKARSINEVVIVRALVSQSGHPSRVSLLRRSKAGPELDDVVVATVNQWTFSPAKKKGEAVSCWLNFGVQVGQPE
jgi:TonB family protein